MSKTKKGGALDDFKMQFEKLPQESKQWFNMAGRTGRGIARNTGAAVSKGLRKVTGLARFRIGKRLSNVEAALRAPSVYEDKHNLEEYVRYIVRDEKAPKRRGRPLGKKDSKPRKKVKK